MKLTERSLAPSVSLIDFVHVVRVEDIGQDPDGSSYKAQVQQLLDLVEPSLYLTGGTYNPNTGILELTDNTGGTITVSGTYSFEDTANKQNNMTVDGFGVKYPTVDAVNFQVNSVALASINTGFIDITDSFYMSRPNDFTLRLNPSNKGLIYQSILQTPPYAPSTAILNIPLTDVPLSGISFTGDGIYVRFIGYNDSGSLVYSDTTFETSISVVQLGILLLKVSGGTTSFLDSIRGIVNKPSICKYDNLEIHMFGLQSDVIVRPNSGMTINNTSGSIKGMSVNWQGADNDIRPVAYTGVTEFTHLSFLNTIVATPPVFTTAVTTDQYWNGSFLQTLSTSGAASIQRWYVTITGRLGLQYGEAEYATLQIAKDNVSTATFLDVIPAGTFAEVARMVAIRDTTDLSNTQQCVFYSKTGGGSAGGSSSTVWGQINGSLTDQVDLKAALDLKQNIITTGGTAYIVPKWNSSGTTLINSNITDYGTGVTISTDINVNSINIGRGNDSSNLFVGYQALGTASTTNNTSVAFGDYALGSLTTGGTNNTALGYSSLYKTTTGNENTAIGQYAAYFNTTGQYNLAIGNSALQSNIASTQNVAIGAFALYTFTGGSGGHTAIGVSAMQKQINGESNLAVGNSALYNGTTCIRNTAIGTLAMYGRLNIPITGQYNIAVGFQASRAITTGSNNLVIGLELNDGITTGNNNIILDPINRPGISTGSGNVVIGGFNSTIPDTSNGVYIGTGAGIMRMFFDSAGTMSISTTPLVGSSIDKILVRTSTGLIKQIDNPISSGATGTTGQVAFYGTSTSLSGSTAFTWNDITKRLIISGSVTANTFAISGGTSNQFLKADGSVSTGATDSNALHLTGNETFTGIKASTILSANTPALDITNPINASNAYGIRVTNTNNGAGIFVTTNTTFGTGIFVTPSAGNGIYVNPSATANGINVSNGGSNFGIAISNVNTTTSDALNISNGSNSGAGILCTNSGTNNGIKINNNSVTGQGLVINNVTSATNKPFQYTKNSIERVYIDDSGNTLAQSFIKSGGTSNQFLMADGSTTVGGIVGSGSANSVAKWSSSSALTTSNISDTGSLITLNSSTNINGIATLLTTAISGRETLFQASITDNAVDKIMIANGTSVGGRFAPGFVGYTQGGYGAIFFRGLGATADDLSANTPYVTFLAANTSLSADPNNGTLTAPSARPMFSWGSVTTYMTMAASGNLLIQNGGTFTDNLTDRLQVGGSVVATSYKINGGSTTQLLKADGTLTTGYRVYTALITQTGTANPSVIILENNMTDTIVWTRTGAGTYQGLATNPIFTTNKTVVFTTKDINGAGDIKFNGSSPGVNQVFLTTVNLSGGVDGELTNATLEIRVYN